MGWSDETEVLCNIASYLFEKVFCRVKRWEDFLPQKYRDCAKYSIIDDTTNDEQIIAGLKAAFNVS